MDINVQPLSSSCKKRGIRTLIFLFLNVLSASVIGIVSLWGVYSLPITSIDRNVKASSSIFLKEVANLTLYNWCTSRLDIYTDALMLLEAANEFQEEDTIKRALLNYQGRIDDLYPHAVLVEHYINGVEFTDNEPYPRYWHGFLIWLKPLLLIFDYQAIRIINGILQASVMIWICCKLFRKNKAEYIIPIALTYGMLMPIALAKSLQFSSCYYIALISTILILHTEKNKACYVFLYAGMLTAYFDFLTYPIATFGIPAVMYFALYKDDCLKEKLTVFFKLGACWVLGYIGLWSLKWIIGGIITGVNIFENAKTAIEFRTSRSNNGTVYSLSDCLSTCFELFTNTPCTYLVCGYCVWEIIKIAKKWAKGHLFIGRCIINYCLPFILIALLPLAWYSMALNHTSIHDYFTNKALSVSAFAIMMLLANIAHSPKKEL